MLIRYIRDKGQIVATIVAVGPGQVGISFVHKNDNKFRRTKVDVVNHRNVYQYDGFRKHVGIEQAVERANGISPLVSVPKKKIDPRNDGVKYPLDQVVAIEFDKMLNRSFCYYATA